MSIKKDTKNVFTYPGIVFPWYIHFNCLDKIWVCCVLGSPISSLICHSVWAFIYPKMFGENLKKDNKDVFDVLHLSV